MRRASAIPSHPRRSGYHGATGRCRSRRASPDIVPAGRRATASISPDTGNNAGGGSGSRHNGRSEEHTSELQSLMRISYAVFCLKKKKQILGLQLRVSIIIRKTTYVTDK